MASKGLSLAWRVVKILALGVILLELVSFAAISVSNYLLYGSIREGSRVRYDPWALYLNVQGVRPTAHNPPAPLPGRIHRIWLFGGSTVRGATPHDDRTIPSFLAQELNRDHSRIPAVVTNYGEDSFNALLEIKYLQKVLIETPDAPQVIVFYDGANDCTYFAQYQTPDAHHGYRRVRALIEGYHRSFWGLLKPLTAAFYASFTKEGFDKSRSLMVPLNPDSPLVQSFCNAARTRYDFVQRQAAALGARFLVVFQPLWWVETGDVSPALREYEDTYMFRGKHLEIFRQNIRVLYQALSQALQEKPYFHNFQNILCSRTEPVYQPDGVHLKDAGRRLAARHLGRLLYESLSPEQAGTALPPTGGQADTSGH